MGLNLPMLRRALARWETYEDRGITPTAFWTVGGDGSACALGDIAHYENVQSEYFRSPAECNVGAALGLTEDVYGRVPDHTGGSGPYMLLALISDCGRWPIAEVRRLIAWEEAALAPAPTPAPEAVGACS